MKIIKEFKEFAMRGNVVDMAVGIIIGGAFGKIVSSIVNDILMPPIGKLMGGVNFKDLYISLDPEKTQGLTSLAQAREKGAAVIAYGEFLNIVIDFAIVAFCVFLLVKAINALRKQVPTSVAPVTKSCPHCISQIPLMATRCPACTSEIK
jgi:large conductance mechanosensitive channel